MDAKIVGAGLTGDPHYNVGIAGELIIPEYGPEQRLFESVVNLMEVTVWNAFSGYAPGAFSKTVNLCAANLMAVIAIISQTFVAVPASG
jgi:hypothetical protein